MNFYGDENYSLRARISDRIDVLKLETKALVTAIGEATITNAASSRTTIGTEVEKLIAQVNEKRALMAELRSVLRG